jgi:histidinol-phosphate/aromatic aminotransferase/cobyric acid decarboxylase-like protein
MSRHGIRPYNVSHWNPEAGFMSKAGIQPKLRSPAQPFEYVFSYRIDAELKSAIAKTLGYKAQRAVVLTTNGTSANLTAMTLLKALGRSRLHIILPVYFQVPIAALEMGLHRSGVYAFQTNDGWSIPELSSLSPATDAVWLTNPIYGMGDRFSDSAVNELTRYMESGGLVVLDECQSSVAEMLSQRMGEATNLIATYSPQKAVLLNAVKLGVVVAAPNHLARLEDLSDVWSGSLTRMAVADAEHLISSDFLELSERLSVALSASMREVSEICKVFECNLKGSNGPFRTLTIDRLPQRFEYSREFLAKIIESSGASLIPTTINYGSDQLPFSFRVNLGRDGVELRSALSRLMTALTNFS